MAIYIEDTETHEEKFVWGDDSWCMDRLIKLAEKLEPFDLPLKALNISFMPFRDPKNISDMVFHMKRTLATDLQYPIILNADGHIMNGWHRVMKAILEGRDSIKAVRFDITPSCDFTVTED